jgi:hypothetical protein
VEERPQNALNCRLSPKLLHAMLALHALHALHALQGPARTLLVDVVPPQQQGLGNGSH